MALTLDIPEGPFDGYIFDCDGTLADSMPLHYRAWSTAFKEHGAKFDFTTDLFYSLAGTGLEHSVVLLNERFQDTLNPKAVVAMQGALLEKELCNVQPIEEVTALAKAYAEHSPISVFSGGSREHVFETLEALGIKELFPVIVTQDDITRSKPHPEGFLKAAELMGVDPTKCLVFEDGALGIQAAEAAGMQCVYVDTRSLH